MGSTWRLASTPQLAGAGLEAGNGNVNIEMYRCLEIHFLGLNYSKFTLYWSHDQKMVWPMYWQISGYYF